MCEQCGRSFFACICERDYELIECIKCGHVLCECGMHVAYVDNEYPDVQYIPERKHIMSRNKHNFRRISSFTDDRLRREGKSSDTRK
jgi:hypothetical protein